MSLFLSAIALCVPLHADKQPSSAPNTPDRQRAERFHQAILLLVALRSEKGGASSISIDNSQVIVKSPVIEVRVSQGMGVIPVVLDLMEVEDISFDTFTKCYSICDQILTGKGKERVKWYGGASTDKAGCLIPSGQVKDPTFRADVIQDIRKKLK